MWMFVSMCFSLSLSLGRVVMVECSSGHYSLNFSVKCSICPAGSRCPAKNVSSFCQNEYNQGSVVGKMNNAILRIAISSQLLNMFNYWYRPIKFGVFEFSDLLSLRDRAQYMMSPLMSFCLKFPAFYVYRFNVLHSSAAIIMLCSFCFDYVHTSLALLR